MSQERDSLFTDLSDEEVFDNAGARYRVSVETRTRRGRPQYRWVIEREWVNWRDVKKGWWTRDAAKAVARGNALLARIDHHKYERVRNT